MDPEQKSLNGLFSLLNIRHPKKFKPFSHWPSKKVGAPNCWSHVAQFKKTHVTRDFFEIYYRSVRLVDFYGTNVGK